MNTERCANRKCAKPTESKFRLEVMRGEDWQWVTTEIGFCKACADSTLTHHREVWPAEYRLVKEAV